MIDPAVLALVTSLRMADPVAVDTDSLVCVAEAVYREARGEPVTAQVGVAVVVLGWASRSSGGACAVIRDRHRFPWNRRHPIDRAGREWWNSVEVALMVVTGAVAPTVQATHFHDDTVSPWWTASMQKMAQFGRMTFWKEMRKTT